MATSGHTAAPEQPPLSPEQQKEVSIARLVFRNLERVTQQLSAYPPGHPAINSSVEATYDALMEYFELTDRLSVAVLPHSLKVYSTEEEVWETEEPRDFCFVLSRDGIFLLHILAGFDRKEVKKLATVLNFLIDYRHDATVQAPAVLFEASFSYLSYDALDESLAALAGIDLDTRNRDTKEEKELIEDLFNKAFQEEKDKEGDDIQGDFEITIKSPAERLKKIEVGSREFLSLEQTTRDHLFELRRGFTEHRELEHREGEILSAILGAKPKESLRTRAIDQVGYVMSELLKTDQPWESLTFLKIIHHWRDKFDPRVTGELRDVVGECFTQARIQELVHQVTTSTKRERRAILQMFNAMHLTQAAEDLSRVVGWDIEEEARKDVVRFLEERARYGYDFLRKTILDIPPEHIEPVLDLLQDGMPVSREIFLVVLREEESTPPEVKVRALRALRGSWEDPREMRDLLVPLTKSEHSEVRVEACVAVCEAAPQHTMLVMGPLFTSELQKRPEEEIRELAQLFVQYGGKPAIDKLEELIRRRGITTTESERALAVTLARALMRTPNPDVIAMLEGVAGDWQVTRRIKDTCKEVLQILKTGT